MYFGRRFYKRRRSPRLFFERALWREKRAHCCENVRFVMQKTPFLQSTPTMEKYSATLGLQPKKSVEFLGAEFVGDLQRDKQDLGPWKFIQRWLPPVPKLILEFFCVPCTPGGCALFFVHLSKSQRFAI